MARRTFMRTIVLRGSVLALLLVVGGLAASVIGASQSEERERAFARVDGIEFDISPGQEITRGVLSGDNQCTFPTFEVTARGTPAQTTSIISGEITADCRVVVTEVAWDQPGVSPSDPSDRPGVGVDPSLAPAEQAREGAAGVLGALQSFFEPRSAQASHISHWKGWSKSELNDGIEIDLVSTYAEMKYYTNSTAETVYGGHAPVNRCEWLTLTGWFQEEGDCTGVWSPSGPSTVWIKTTGDFVNLIVVPLFEVTTSAKFSSSPFSWSSTCTTTSAPGGTHWHCQGGRASL